MILIKSIQSELIKTKYPPILWLIAFTILTTAAIIFSAHYIDIHGAIKLGVNPWSKINNAGSAIFSSFMATPFIVMFISAFIFIERQNHGFKQLYTLPKKRESLVLYKISSFLLCLLIAIFILMIANVLVACLLNFIYPETEFSYYSIPFDEIIKSYFSIFICLLGIIGIQFFLSYLFKGFLVPASVGIIAYIVGLILPSTNNPLCLYFPYSFPILGIDGGVFNNNALKIKQFSIFSQVELQSIIVFVVFILFCLFQQRKKNI